MKKINEPNVSETSVRDQIDREVKRLVGKIRRRDNKSDRSTTAAGLSLLAVAAIQKDDSKAKKLLNLMRELGL